MLSAGERKTACIPPYIYVSSRGTDVSRFLYSEVYNSYSYLKTGTDPEGWMGDTYQEFY